MVRECYLVRIAHVERLIDAGSFSSSADWRQVEAEVTDAIHAVQWPRGSGKFILHDQPGRKRGMGSGVKPIKEACMSRLLSLGWEVEVSLPIAARKQPGKIDAIRRVGERFFVLEWETGNISSSHRALNKMALGLIRGILIGGALIVPTRVMYKYLTDRVGNYAELEPYFPLWQSLNVSEGLLLVIAVEQDAVSPDVPRIPKGTDGRALI
jgi:hypothetical protein